MCIFTGPVREVAATRIFARMLRPRTQCLAYEAQVGADRDVAMVLALPVDPRTGENAVRFIDLSGVGASRLFADLQWLFRAPPRKGAAVSGGVARGAVLAVHDVGDYEASYVPTGDDFARLDRRFRLSQRLVRALRRRGERGYAVFKLRASDEGSTRRLHPLGLVFRTREPGTLFFPTLHVHERTLTETAHFDYVLYAQGAPFPRGRASHAAPDAFLARRSRGIVAANEPVYRLALRGERDNDDVRVSLVARR